MSKPIEYKYHARFQQTFKINPLSKEAFATQKTAIASNEALQSIAPKIDKIENPDLLAVALDAALANIVNANDDGILTPTAKILIPKFVHKPINIEHNRGYILGAITNSTASSFSEDKVLDLASIEDSNLDPFKISVGGVLWRVASSYIVEDIEEANEPDIPGDEMEEYWGGPIEYCGSWEVGFNEFFIALGSKKLKDAEIVTDAEKIKELSQYLKACKGSGMLPDGTPVYRVITGNDVTALGVGLTTNPAAEVDSIWANVEKSKKIISTTESQRVKTPTKQTMKINEVADINDDVMKEAKASDMREFIKSEILKKDKEMQDQAKALDQKAKDAEAKASQEASEKATAQAKLKEVEDKVVTLSSEIQQLKAEKEAKASEDAYNTRINAIAEKYELSDDLRNIVHSQVKACKTDEDFTKWQADFAVMAKSFEKKKEEDNKGKKVDATDAATQIVSKASVQTQTPPNTQSESQEAPFAKVREALASKEVKNGTLSF